MHLEFLMPAVLPAYKAYSKFPRLRRDLAIVVANEVSADRILDCVRKAAGQYLQNLKIFDLYRGPGIDSSRKSIGLGLILQGTYRTLTDEDADGAVAAVVERLGSELGATIRT
jgi:phenylalanyl-tRNA synthetase beta chain